MPARAVHIVQRMAPGGIETLVLDLVTSHPDGDLVYSLEGNHQELAGGWRALAPITDRLRCFGHVGGLSPRLLARLVHKLSVDRPHTVVVHHIGPYLYGGVAARLTGVPILVHVEHDGWHLERVRHRKLTQRLDRVLRPRHVAVSGSVAAALAAVVPGADIRVVRNGVNLERFQPGERAAARCLIGLPPDLRVVGSAGRLLPVKGHDILIRAAQHLPADVHIVIAGGGEAAIALGQLARELGIEARVHLIGHRDDVQSILPAFDVFCLPSRNEGLPRSVVEAQACGVPVVASDVGGLREAVCAVSGRLVPAGNPAALAQALGSVLAAARTVSPRTFVTRRFAWSDTVAGYENAMERADAA